MSVRPFIRVFDSNDYVNQLATNELCVAMAWSSDYSTAVLRSRAAGLDLHLAFTLPREGSNVTYNALLIRRERRTRLRRMNSSTSFSNRT